MSLSSQNLDAFLACAQRRHFTEAARNLRITQSALSQRIANLEQQIGTQLLIRDRTGVRPTPAGEELLRYAIARDDLEREAIERMTGGTSSGFAGAIRIGGFSSVMRSVVLPALAPMLRKYPEIRLTFITKELAELPNFLRRGEIDLLITYQEHLLHDLEVIPLGQETNFLVERVGYDGPDIYLDHDIDDEATARYLRKVGSRGPVTRRYLDDVYGLIDGVQAGLGRAILPIHLIANEKNLRIVDRKNPLQFPVLLSFYRRAYYSRLHESVVAALRKDVPRLLADRG